MFRHAVALVMLKAIAGIMQAQSRHQAVAGHLRHDRSSCNRGDDCVATYDGLAIAIDIDPVAAVHEYELWLHRQRGNGAGKRPQRGAQDIVAVNTPRPRGTRLGSRMTAAATTGPANGPLPASSHPAIGQTPRLSAARSRRKVGRIASSPSGNLSSTGLAPCTCSRLIPRWCLPSRPSQSCKLGL